MLKRYGCGCIYLDTGAGRGRLFKYCGGGSDRKTPEIGADVRLADVLRSDALIGAPLSSADTDTLLARLAELVRKGHKYESLRATFAEFLED